MALTRFPESGDLVTESALTNLFKHSLLDFVVSGFTVSGTSGLDVTLASGEAQVSGYNIQENASSTVTVNDNDTTYIYLKSDGTFSTNTTGVTPSNAIDIASAVASGGSISETNDLRTTSFTEAAVGAADFDAEVTSRILNDLRIEVARLNFEHSLSDLGYDSGLFDIFRDESKIASKTNVVVSTLDGGDSDGKVDLPVSALSATSRPADDDSRSESRINGVWFTPNVACVAVDVVISANPSGYNEARLADGTTVLDTKDISGLATGETVRLYAEMAAGSDYQVGLGNTGGYTEGHNNSVSFPISGTDVDIISAAFGIPNTQKTGEGGSNMTPNILSVTPVQVDSSGSFTSTQQDLGLIPSSVVISQDADIPADEDIQYVIRDTAATPNTVRVLQSDIDESVDTSVLTTQTIDVKVELSSDDGGDMCTLRSYALHANS